LVTSIKFRIINKLLFSIILISATNFFSQKKEGIATYKAKTSYSFEKIEKENEKELLNKTFEDSGKESSINFKLLFKNEKSVFFAEKSLTNESEKIDFVSIKAKILGKIYVNLITKEILQHKEKFGEVFNIKSNLNNHHWILTKETIKIGNYTCFKAILKTKGEKKNKTIAWYAPKLPYSLGPMGYCGLPGLVIVLKDDIFIYTLKQITFNLSKKEEKIVFKPKIGKEVSLKEYDSIYKIIRERKDKIEKENYMKN
jgi:GLPGLI family protein